MFILPQKVLEEVTKICGAFLWSGQHFTSKPGLVAWEQLCNNKDSGGLGFMDVKLWNVACLGKYVWEIYSKQENVWIKWINAVYLRGEDWWDYKPKVEASWYCKKICGVKEQMKTKYTNEELVRMMKYSIKGVYEAMKGANSKIE